MSTVFLGLGSNLGNGRENLQHAIDLLDKQVGPLLVQSAMIESEPWGFASEHRFTNAVAAFKTRLQPRELLLATQAIEKEMGRCHKHQKGEPYTDRIIDIDILLYDDLAYTSDDLVIPHPLIAEREFVSVPLQECREKLVALSDIETLKQKQ